MPLPTEGRRFNAQRRLDNAHSDGGRQSAGRPQNRQRVRRTNLNIGVTNNDDK